MHPIKLTEGKPLSRIGIELQGHAAFEAGEPQESNPHHRTSRKNGGIMKAAWWSAGWIKASNGKPV